MSIRLSPLFFWVFLSLATGASAQETTDGQASESTSENAEASEEAADPGGLSMGVPDGEGEVAVGQTYVAETHTDWELRCIRQESGRDPCQLYQLLRDEQNNPVAEFSLFNLTDNGRAVAGATVITPLETLLTEQLRLAVDGGQTRRYPFSFCSQIGCFSRIGFTQEEIDQFRRGAKATVTISPAAAPNETVNLTLSLSGFTNGWNAVVAANSGEAEN